jgi:hypothetical protein
MRFASRPSARRRDHESVEPRPENLREPVHNDPYVARNVAPVRMNERKRQRLARVVRKDFDHLPGSDTGEHARAHRLDDTKSGNARRVIRLGAIHGDHAAHGLFAIDRAIAMLEAWRIRAEARGVVNDQVLVQIVERPRRPVLPEI